MASKITAVQNDPRPGAADVVQPLSTKSLFWQADYLIGSPALATLPFLFWTVESAAPRTLVSLSDGPQEAYFALCQAVQRLGLETRCFSISEAIHDPEDVRHNADTYEDFSSLLSGPQDANCARFAPASIDMLYLDLAHPPEDLVQWPALLSPRNVLLIHGANAPEFFAARTACLESLRIENIDFTLEHGNGLGLVLGEDAPSRLKRLAELHMGAPGYSEVQKVFFRLGKAHENAFHARQNRRENNQQKKELNQLRAALETTQSDLEKMREKNAKLRSAYENRNAQMALIDARHFDAITAIEQELKEVQQTSRDRKKKLKEALEEAIRQTDAKIERLKEQVAALTEAAVLQERALEEATAHNDRLQAEHDSLQAAALDNQAHVETLEDTVARQNRELADLVFRAEDTRTGYESKLDWLRSEVSKHKNTLLKATQAQDTAKQETTALKAQLDARTEELVTLTQLLETKTAEANRALLESETQRDILIELRNAEIAMLRNAGGRLRRGDAMSSAGLPTLKSQTATLMSSDLFDAEWYLKTYPDVGENGMDPARHYAIHGALDGRNPGPSFDTMAYYRANRDVAKRGLNALVHYEMFGREEKRRLK
ncbi:MAG: hypothetical protein AAF216_01290 [Pseudomonadota bacterium]